MTIICGVRETKAKDLLLLFSSEMRATLVRSSHLTEANENVLNHTIVQYQNKKKNQTANMNEN